MYNSKYKYNFLILFTILESKNTNNTNINPGNTNQRTDTIPNNQRRMQAFIEAKLIFKGLIEFINKNHHILYCKRLALYKICHATKENMEWDKELITPIVNNSDKTLTDIHEISNSQTFLSLHNLLGLTNPSQENLITLGVALMQFRNYCQASENAVKECTSYIDDIIKSGLLAMKKYEIQQTKKINDTQSVINDKMMTNLLSDDDVKHKFSLVIDEFNELDENIKTLNNDIDFSSYNEEEYKKKLDDILKSLYQYLDASEKPDESELSNIDMFLAKNAEIQERQNKLASRQKEIISAIVRVKCDINAK